MLKDFLRIKKLLGRRGSGNFGALLHGSGVDLAENREYVPGDEKRSINWKMSAKYHTLFVNLFHDEKTLDVHLCCDINYNRKGGNAILFLGFLAGLTQYFKSEKVHITGRIADDMFLSLEKLPYQKQFLDAFRKTTKALLPIYHSSLANILHKQLSIPKRRLVIIVSDFLSCNDEEQRLLGALRQKNEVRLVQVPTSGGSMKISKDVLSLEIFR